MTAKSIDHYSKYFKRDFFKMDENALDISIRILKQITQGIPCFRGQLIRTTVKYLIIFSHFEKSKYFDNFASLLACMNIASKVFEVPMAIQALKKEISRHL